MKEISVKIDDKLYRSVSLKVDNLEAEVNRNVSEYLEAIDGADNGISAARLRMAELFHSTTGFGVGTRPSRDEMHERRSIR